MVVGSPSMMCKVSMQIFVCCATQHTCDSSCVYSSSKTGCQMTLTVTTTKSELLLALDMVDTICSTRKSSEFSSHHVVNYVELTS